MGKFCKKCNNFLELTNFYKTKNTKNYLDGHIDWCKKCLKDYRSEKKKVKDDKPMFYVEKKDLTMSFE